MSKVFQIKRKDGSLSPMWHGRFMLNGKRTKRAFSIYPKIAQNMLDEMEHVGRAQKDGRNASNMPWGHFKELFLKFSVNKRNKKTHAFNKQMFKIVEKYLFIQTINQMTPERLEHLDLTMKEKGHAPVAAGRIIRGIKTAMRWAEDRKYVPMQNWRTVEVIEPPGREDFYERSAFDKLLSKLEDPWLTAVWLMGHAGLRLGEMYYLEWSDIQLANRRIVFRSKPHFDWKIKGEKKVKLTRKIPLTLDENLERHLQSTARPQGFVLSEDRPSSRDWFSKRMGEILVATEVKTHLGKNGTAHTLRHTFGSHLAQMGVSLPQIQQLMGHASIRMTMVYAHLVPDDVKTIKFNGFMETSKNVSTKMVPCQTQPSTTTHYLTQNDEVAHNTYLSSKTSETLRETKTNTILGR